MVANKLLIEASSSHCCNRHTSRAAGLLFTRIPGSFFVTLELDTDLPARANVALKLFSVKPVGQTP